MSAPPYSVDDYLAALQALLPRGRAWPRDATAVPTQVLRGLAQNLADFTSQANNLLVDAFPATTDNLLPEWNETLGLPGLTGYTGDDLPTQQAQVVAAFTDSGGQSPAFFIALASALGIPISINGYRPYRVNDHVNDPIYGAGWAHVWRVNVLSDVDYQTLVVLFNLYKPAHTTVLFGSPAPPPPPTDPYFASVVFLINGDAIADTKGHALLGLPSTADMNVTTADPDFPHGAVDFVNPSTGIVAAPIASEFNIGAGDFTIEFDWKYAGNNHTDKYQVLLGTYDPTNTGAGSEGNLRFFAENTLSFPGKYSLAVGGAWVMEQPVTPGVLYQTALQRRGGVLTVYENGVVVYTGADSTIYNFVDGVNFGSSEFATGLDFNFRYLGLIGKMRITRAARYVGAYTPTRDLWPTS